MREHEDRLTPEEAFRRRLVYEVERLAGEIEAICVDMQIATKPRFIDNGTARSIRAIVKDDHFVQVVNKLNLVRETIKDPGTAERILSDCLTGNGITKWADAQPAEDKERWLRGKAEVMLSNSVFSNINDAVLRSMPSENVGGPSFLAKHEGSPFQSRPDDDSEADQSDEHSPDEVWVRPYKQQRHGKTVSVRGYPRHHTPSQHEEEHSGAADTDSEDTDIAGTQLAQFHRDAEAHLEQKKAMFNNNSDNRQVDTDVTPRDSDAQPPAIPATVYIPRAALEDLAAPESPDYRAGRQAFRDALELWLGLPKKIRTEDAFYHLVPDYDGSEFSNGFYDQWRIQEQAAELQKDLQEIRDRLNWLSGAQTRSRSLSEYERATMQRAMDKTGLKLRESPNISEEFLDEQDHAYDAMGTPQASKYWNWQDFQRSIDRHLLKSNTTTIIDLTDFAPEQISRVRNYVNSLAPELQKRIIRIGF